MFLTPSTTGG